MSKKAVECSRGLGQDMISPKCSGRATDTTTLFLPETERIAVRRFGDSEAPQPENPKSSRA